MQHMETDRLEVQMVLQCAPVIAGLKVSNLLIIPERQLKELAAMLKDGPIGMYLLLKENDRLIFLIYNKEWMEQLISESEQRAFLDQAGYKCVSLQSVLFAFRKRYEAYHKGQVSFPHEMGVLLGYPMEDVKGFIYHRGTDYLCNGYWKVYRNAEKKKRTFCWYASAEQHLLSLLRYGRSIPEIIGLYLSRSLNPG